MVSNLDIERSRLDVGRSAFRLCPSFTLSRPLPFQQSTDHVPASVNVKCLDLSHCSLATWRQVEARAYPSILERSPGWRAIPQPCRDRK